MQLRAGIVWAVAAVLVSSASPAEVTKPQAWFNEGIRDDIAGDTHAAFESYLRAAEAGLPAAEFNVAVMLDSGRGVPSDIKLAATWYARAAAHGNHRAAYNLGQLYEEGQGVPRNLELARAWFYASGLEAARVRVSRLPMPFKVEGTLNMPTPIAPRSGTKLETPADGVELVWTAEAQPEPVRYFVELREIEPSGSHEVFARFLPTSSVLAVLPHAGAYEWRILAVAGKTGHYSASDWSSFSAVDNQK